MSTEEIHDLSMARHQDKGVHMAGLLLTIGGIIFTSTFLARRQIKTQVMRFPTEVEDVTNTNPHYQDNTNDQNDDGAGVAVALILILMIIGFMVWAADGQTRVTSSQEYVYNPRTGMYEPQQVRSRSSSSSLSSGGSFDLLFGLLFGWMLF